MYQIEEKSYIEPTYMHEAYVVGKTSTNCQEFRGMKRHKEEFLLALKSKGGDRTMRLCYHFTAWNIYIAIGYMRIGRNIEISEDGVFTLANKTLISHPK